MDRWSRRSAWELITRSARRLFNTFSDFCNFVLLQGTSSSETQETKTEEKSSEHPDNNDDDDGEAFL